MIRLFLLSDLTSSYPRGGFCLVELIVKGTSDGGSRHSIQDNLQFARKQEAAFLSDVLGKTMRSPCGPFSLHVTPHPWNLAGRRFRRICSKGQAGPGPTRHARHCYCTVQCSMRASQICSQGIEVRLAHLISLWAGKLAPRRPVPHLKGEKHPAGNHHDTPGLALCMPHWGLQKNP
jgi:hypothetical protein